MREYVLENQRWHKRAEMLVRVEGDADETKHFEVVSEMGWKAAQKHVLRKVLESEAEASSAAIRNETRLSSENYEFRMVTTALLSDRMAYVIDVVPKRRNERLFEGKIWIDAQDYALERVEGETRKEPILLDTQRALCSYLSEKWSFLVSSFDRECHGGPYFRRDEPDDPLLQLCAEFAGDAGSGECGIRRRSDSMIRNGILRHLPGTSHVQGQSVPHSGCGKWPPSALSLRGSPKPLVQLHGKSLLEHVILGAREAGIERFVIVVGYGADAMRRWLKEHPTRRCLG